MQFLKSLWPDAPEPSSLLVMIEDMERRMREGMDLDYRNLQTWNMMLPWPVGEEKNLDGTLSRKVYQDDHMMIFDFVSPPGASFNPQWHDCQEVTIVTSGQMADMINPGLWTKNQIYVMEPHRKHQPYNHSTTEVLTGRCVFIK